MHQYDFMHRCLCGSCTAGVCCSMQRIRCRRLHVAAYCRAICCEKQHIMIYWCNLQRLVLDTAEYCCIMHHLAAKLSRLCCIMQHRLFAGAKRTVYCCILHNFKCALCTLRHKNIVAKCTFTLSLLCSLQRYISCYLVNTCNMQHVMDCVSYVAKMQH